MADFLTASVIAVVPIPVMVYGTIVYMQEVREMEEWRIGLGALLGLFVGDAFGAQGEFISEATLALAHRMASGRWMSASLHRRGRYGHRRQRDGHHVGSDMIERGTVDSEAVRSQYIRWLDALPSDIGNTILTALREGRMNGESQANGALMRVAPIALAGARLRQETIIAFSDRDCAITHIHPVCRDANRLWALATAQAIREGLTGEAVYAYLQEIAPKVTDEQILLETIKKAKEEAPASCDGWGQGWVVLAFHLSLHTLLHAPSIEEGIRAITMRGGDSDTNAAIYGALAGAVAGADAIPDRWLEALRPTRCLEDLLGAEAKDIRALAARLAHGLLQLSP